MTVAVAGIHAGFMTLEHTMPLVVRPDGGVELAAWARDNREWIDTTLLEHGAILFRGFGVDAEPAFERVSREVCGPLLDYVYRSTPRTAVGTHVYTATEYRADASIPMHSENAFQRAWPMRIAFCCVQPAASGGETPLARTAAVTSRLDADIVRTFAARGVMYVRNYGHGIDLSWETAFQTSSKAEVEAYCRQHDIEWEWRPNDRLRTRQVCQGVARHPATGQELWFNQAHLFHVSSLDADERDALLELFDEADLPRNAYFGDGAPLDEAMLRGVRAAYDAERLVFPWEKGDVLLADNLLVAHGRMPYGGARRVLVAMGRLFEPARPS